MDFVKLATESALRELKGIWENDSCVRCGACCYYCHVRELDKSRESFCAYLQIDETKGSARCIIEEDGKPEECRNFFCDRIHVPLPQQRQELRNCAVDLGTMPVEMLERQYD